MGLRGPKPKPPIERFMAKVVEGPNGCWDWTGATSGGRSPRPLFFPGGKRLNNTVRAHRWIYTYMVGPIPEGFDLDHTCNRGQHCVNPDHLDPCTPYENQHVRRVARQTGCRRMGHTNFYVRKNGARQCRDCAAEYQRQRRARRRDAHHGTT